MKIFENYHKFTFFHIFLKKEKNPRIFVIADYFVKLSHFLEWLFMS